MQGRLREEALSVTIRTECGHCGRAFHITLDSALNYQVEEQEAEPLVFEPHLDWASFTEPNILHAY